MTRFLRGLLEELKGIWHGLTCNDERCECRFIPTNDLAATAPGPVIGGCGPGDFDHYPDAPQVLKRFPKYPLGCWLRKGAVVGVVAKVVADVKIGRLTADLSHFAFTDEEKFSSDDQVLYYILTVVAWKGRKIATGGYYVGENDVELASADEILRLEEEGEGEA
jgi:hypothetical protein